MGSTLSVPDQTPASAPELPQGSQGSQGLRGVERGQAASRGATLHDQDPRLPISPVSNCLWISSVCVSMFVNPVDCGCCGCIKIYCCGGDEKEGGSVAGKEGSGQRGGNGGYRHVIHHMRDMQPRGCGAAINDRKPQGRARQKPHESNPPTESRVLVASLSVFSDPFSIDSPSRPQRLARWSV